MRATAASSSRPLVLSSYRPLVLSSSRPLLSLALQGICIVSTLRVPRRMPTCPRNTSKRHVKVRGNGLRPGPAGRAPHCVRARARGQATRDAQTGLAADPPGKRSAMP